ncbi:MAG: PAS domain S-box protein, partial [Gammaproteobacteria bacterium]|nr:PAS domain S-box protein [Gammaproteobacteria bacterium]
MSKSIQQLEYELKNAKARIEELELREQSQLVELTLHSQILQNMSEGVYMVSADDSAIVYANPVFEKMFGYEHGELVGKHVSIVNAPDTHPEKTASDIIGYLEKTGRWQGEIKNIKKDGTVFWCLANVSLYKSSQYGSVYISVHQDITQQKKIEGELAKKSEFENRLFETAQVIILVLDTEGRIVNINPYMESKTGYKLDEIVGKDWFDTFIPGPDQKAIRELFRTCIHDIKTNGNINPILTKNGELIDVEWYDSTLKDSKGSVIGLLAIGQDVTEKRKSQIEHQKTLGSLIEIQNAMDLIGLGIHMVTMDGEFLYVNDAAANMLGYSKQELLGKGIEGIDPNYTKESFSRVTSSLRCNNPGKIETTQLSKNGVLIPVEVAFHYFPETTNRPEHFISFLTDLTERKAVDAENKKLQQQLLQSQKMEAIGHLTGGIAHDFNNMLAAILG